MGTLSEYNDLALTIPVLTVGCIVLVLLSTWHFTILEHAHGSASLTFLVVFALNPSFVYYSAEFKPYGFDLLVSILSLTLLHRFTTDKEPWVNLFLFTAIAPFFSLPSFFVLPFLYLSILVTKRKVFLNCLLCGVAASPFAIFALVHAFVTMPPAMENIQDLFAPTQFSKDAAAWWIGRAMHFFRGPAYCGFTPWNVKSFLIVLSIVPWMLFVLGLFEGRKEPWIWMCIGIIMTVFIASACHYWKINPGASLVSGRLILFLAPFIYLPLEYGLSAVFRKSRPVGRLVAIFISHL